MKDFFISIIFNAGSVSVKVIVETWCSVVGAEASLVMC